jgi:hypothetical protein
VCGRVGASHNCMRRQPAGRAWAASSITHRWLSLLGLCLVSGMSVVGAYVEDGTHFAQCDGSGVQAGFVVRLVHALLGEYHAALA